MNIIDRIKIASSAIEASRENLKVLQSATYFKSPDGNFEVSISAAGNILLTVNGGAKIGLPAEKMTHLLDFLAVSMEKFNKEI